MNYPERLKDGNYHVKNGEKEIGKYKTLSGAKKACDSNEGSAVFTEDGAKVYPDDNVAVEKIEGQTVAEQTKDQADLEQEEINAPKTAVLKALMNVRKTPSMNGEVITTAKAGAEVSVLAVDGDWLKVDWKGNPAYILYEGGKYADLK